MFTRIPDNAHLVGITNDNGDVIAEFDPTVLPVPEPMSREKLEQELLRLRRHYANTRDVNGAVVLRMTQEEAGWLATVIKDVSCPHDGLLGALLYLGTRFVRRWGNHSTVISTPAADEKVAEVNFRP